MRGCVSVDVVVFRVGLLWGGGHTGRSTHQYTHTPTPDPLLPTPTHHTPDQVTSVGMTMKPNADGSLPSVEVYSFHTCGEEALDTAVNVRKEPMG